ncbi:hypothetical protein Tco_1494233, partial [Tanacetum coccineum]
GHDESSSLYVELGLTESDTESNEEMPPIVKSGDQDEGQAGPDPGIHNKGQVEPNPDEVYLYTSTRELTTCSDR